MQMYTPKNSGELIKKPVATTKMALWHASGHVDVCQSHIAGQKTDKR
jgi:hypothetical protein